MKDAILFWHERRNFKFYADDTKKSFENRTSDQSWEIDTSIYASSALKRYEKDKENPHKYNKEGDWILNLIKSGTINDMSFPQDNKDWKL